MIRIDTKLSCTCPVPTPPEHPLRSSDASLIDSCASDPVVPGAGLGDLNPVGRHLPIPQHRRVPRATPIIRPGSGAIARPWPHALVGLRRLGPRESPTKPTICLSG